ncbi:MAG TPA: hypothetical protein PKC76_11980 [Saprospiraceae bacterium]|nr:hypothetical protein [Saprospiraceae bacterium]HMP24847.1 hypothetical protein [Saprospiraceae bacterium]
MTLPLSPPSVGLFRILNVCQGQEVAIKPLLQSLQTPGIEYDERRSEASQMVLIFFDTCPPSEELTALLQNESTPGCRIIAIRTQEGRLPCHKVWEWLQMGITEVFSLSETPRLVAVLSKRLQRWKTICRVMESDRVRRQIIGRSAP